LDATATEHIATAVASARRDLRRMEQFTHASAKRSALQYYLMGLPLGAVVGILLVVGVFESQTVGRLASNSLLSSCKHSAPRIVPGPCCGRVAHGMIARSAV
jgi:hypothetical protein